MVGYFRGMSTPGMLLAAKREATSLKATSTGHLTLKGIVARLSCRILKNLQLIQNDLTWLKVLFSGRLN
jgi:hypothetical protein